MTTLSRNYFQALATGLRSHLITKVPFYPMDTSGIGSFPWEWQNNGVFNADTFDFVNNVIRYNSDGYFEFAEALNTAYANLMQNITYKIPAYAQANLDALLSKTTTTGDQILKLFLKNETITQAELSAALKALGVSSLSKLGYIINYKLAYIWSGRQSAGLAAYTKTEMLAMPSVTPLFTDAPSYITSGFRALVTTLFETTNQWETLFNHEYGRGRIPATIVENVMHPSIQNGGRRMAGNSKGEQINIAYDISPSVNAIQTALENTGSTQAFDFVIQKGPSNTIKVSMNKGNVFQTSPGFLIIRDENDSAIPWAKILNKSEIQLTKTLSGVCSVKVIPLRFDSTKLTDWYYPQLIEKSYSQYKIHAKSNFYFQLTPSYNFNAEGNFAIIDTLIISQNPVFEFNTKTESLGALNQLFDNNKSYTIELFDNDLKIPVKYHVDETTANRSTSSGVKLHPGHFSERNALKSHAYIAGVQPAYPGLNIF